MPSWTRLMIAVLVLVAAGCPAADQTGDTTAIDTQPGASAQPADTAVVQATLTEWSITLAEDTLSSGPVTFRVANRGTVRHAFEVEGGGEEWVIDSIAPGAEATVSAQLAPGTYEVYCPIEDDRGNHQTLGMRTTLVVRERSP